MIATICHQHRKLIPQGQRCPECEARDQQRRHQRNINKGRNTRHWRRISTAARARDGGCVVCGSTEELTVDYEGDHSKALIRDTVTLCRTHHGEKDGGKTGRFF